MTEGPTRPVRRRPPRRRRGPLIAGVVALVLAFLAGIALGEALHDNPNDGGSRTFVRTIEPFAATVTVTVTTTGR